MRCGVTRPPTPSRATRPSRSPGCSRATCGPSSTPTSQTRRSDMSDNEPRQLREIRETATEHPRWAHIHGWDELLSYIDAEAKRAADLTRELELLDARLHLRLAEERARADEAEAKLAGVITLVESQLSDRKSTRLNSSHSQISYAVFCLKKKKRNNIASLMVDRKEVLSAFGMNQRARNTSW